MSDGPSFKPASPLLRYLAQRSDLWNNNSQVKQSTQNESSELSVEESSEIGETISSSTIGMLNDFHQHERHPFVLQVVPATPLFVSVDTEEQTTDKLFLSREVRSSQFYNNPNQQMWRPHSIKQQLASSRVVAIELYCNKQESERVLWTPSHGVDLFELNSPQLGDDSDYLCVTPIPKSKQTLQTMSGMSLESGVEGFRLCCRSSRSIKSRRLSLPSWSTVAEEDRQSLSQHQFLSNGIKRTSLPRVARRCLRFPEHRSAPLGMRGGCHVVQKRCYAKKKTRWSATSGGVGFCNLPTDDDGTAEDADNRFSDIGTSIEDANNQFNRSLSLRSLRSTVVASSTVSCPSFRLITDNPYLMAGSEAVTTPASPISPRRSKSVDPSLTVVQSFNEELPLSALGSNESCVIARCQRKNSKQKRLILPTDSLGSAAPIIESQVMNEDENCSIAIAAHTCSTEADIASRAETPATTWKSLMQQSRKYIGAESTTSNSLPLPKHEEAFLEIIGRTI